ncbi:MAG TPA: TonB-dependent receptor [Thermoanaerobaculia bacterium]|jgi:outer membrane receptor protein involved in Fe transport|nr:TonB-dependent receptor [Thermoanaerobaculia bacterium]
MLAALILAQVVDTITVTATRTETRVADTPASVVVLSSDALRASAAPTVDDALRQVAGFTLFRRSGSRVANPTAQGVTLRGVGASGASRALVLDDGVPLNDPFGGWIYWGRVPRVALDRAEVLRGGASDLYGSSAMGGVIQFIRRKSPALTFEASAGSQETGTASLFASGEHASVAVDLMKTGGYVLVRPSQRGAVDVAADSEHAAIDGTLRSEHTFLRASYYDESRHNGTPLQVNDTTIRQLAGGFNRGSLALRAYASDQDYYQTFSAVDGDRNGERLTVEQRVPSRGAGASAQWTRTFGSRHVLVAGTDYRYAKGRSDEQRGAVFVTAGGTQNHSAAFVEDLFAVTPTLSIAAGVRADRWRETEVSPRLSVLWHANDVVALSASAYSAFRAPTLNELHRGFRVGNVNTLPNPDLRSEKLTGYELGARFRNARITLFSMHVDDTIANVTIAQTPSLITRQRQNLGETRSRGAELDAEWQRRDWRASASWLFVDARVIDGKRIPQVPRHQATAQLSWRRLGAQARWSAMQFDDDLNQFPLASYFVADAFVAYPLRGGFEVNAALENVFDREVEVSATPVVTLGQPRAFRLGLRYAR